MSKNYPTLNPTLSCPSYPGEQKIQAECFQWAWNERPATRRLLFHVPNGGKRDKIEAARLKATGVVPGIPDFIFCWQRITYFIEMKTQVGTLSKDQKAVHAQLNDQGFRVFTVRTFEEFKHLIDHIIQL